jgi:hypothetical protein
VTVVGLSEFSKYTSLTIFGLIFFSLLRHHICGLLQYSISTQQYDFERCEQRVDRLNSGVAEGVMYHDVQAYMKQVAVRFANQIIVSKTSLVANHALSIA